MYNIYADGVCIYSDVFALEATKALNPKLTLEDCSAGSLSITLPMKNAGYDTVERLNTDITVEKDGQEIWMGRVLSENKDFWNNRVLYCEGQLAFFNDSTQPPKKYSGYTVRGYLEALIDIHNSKVPENRQIQLGAVTVSDESTPDYFTNFEKTIASLNALIERYGGHMRIRREDGIGYLDYLEECPNTCTQTIQMGVNLLDFTKAWDMSEFATVIVPLGARLEESAIEELDAYLTVKSVNNDSPYVQSAAAVAAYGWIEKTVNWDDETDPEELLRKAQEYLSELQFDDMQLELSALDMHYLNVDTEAVKLLDEIRVISYPHGLDRLFPVTKLEIPLDSPEKTQFKLGDTVKTSLTSVNDQKNTEILDKIEKLPKAHNILREAKENATAIMHMATTGFITITKDEYGSETLYISNTRDYTNADKLWKWNMNGLGYSADGGETYGLAITMDGAIVADFITAGVLNGNVIRAGVIKDYNGNVEFDLDNGILVMKKGSIQLGAYSQESKHYKFEVDNDGNLYAGSGTFGGNLAGAKGTFGGELVAVSGSFVGTVQAEDFLDRSGKSMMNDGKFTSDYLELRGLTITNGVTTTFKVSSTGTVEINGKVTMGSGSSINWAQVSNTNLSSNPAYALASQASSDAYDAAYDASLAYSRASDAYAERCNSANVFDVLTSGGTKFGIFSDSTTSKLYINADYIRAGTIDAAYISLEGNYGGFCQGYGSDGVSSTTGALMYGSGEPYFIVTNKGCRMEGTAADFWVAGGVYSSEEITVKSDLRLKNTINFDLDRYEDFFMSLKPAQFKYNDGTSGRLHLGFIAQDIEEALIQSGLTAIDLAALVKDPVKEIRDDGISDFRYGLRYGEFIALNTYMIQKLYRMVNQLIQEKGESS